MIDKEKIIRAFDNVTPSDEVVEAIINKRFGKRKITRLFKTAAAAACACLVISMSAIAAASGIFDFKEIFGGYIDIKSNDLGDQLMGRAENITYTISDDDYRIDVKGVTGGIDSLYAVIEISRKDGTPAVEHFLNPLPDAHYGTTWMFTQNGIGNAGGGWDHIINDNGNIEYIVSLSGDALNGETFNAEGECLVLQDEFRQYCNCVNAYYGEYYDEEKGWIRCWKSYEGMQQPLYDFECDDSSFMLLPIKWKISFTYKVSELSSKTLICKDPKQKTVYYETALAFKELPNGETEEYRTQIGHEITVKKIEVSAAGGTLVFDYVPADKFKTPDFLGNEIYLALSDGTQIKMRLTGVSGTSIDSNGETCKMEMTANIVFIGENGKTISFTDVSKGRSIYINGTEYKLK